MAVETLPASPTLLALVPSFRRHLMAANRSPKTDRCYLSGARRLGPVPRSERHADRRGPAFGEST